MQQATTGKAFSPAVSRHSKRQHSIDFDTSKSTLSTKDRPVEADVFGHTDEPLEEPPTAAAPDTVGRMSKRHKPDDMTPTKVFKLMELPPELREIIYYHAMIPIKPIDTAAIPNTPDRVRIPPIAQLDKVTRHETLHILFTSRPIDISLHSDENLRRALLWANKWQDHARALPKLIFSGRIKSNCYEFFTITITISDEAPFVRATAKPAASQKSDEFIASLKEHMLAWLDMRLSDVNGGRDGKLSGEALVELISLVANAADGTRLGMTMFPFR